ncbi:unnamed protein product, partial [Rotaria sp. Silwood2]
EEQDDFTADDQTSLSPSISTDLQQKQPTFMQQENQSINSSSPSSSFLTPMQPLTSSNNDRSVSSIEHHQMTSSPNHENETIPFEPCRTSPNAPIDDESVTGRSVKLNIQSNIVDELEQ